MSTSDVSSSVPAGDRPARRETSGSGAPPPLAWLRIAGDSAVAPFEQIRGRIAEAAAGGRLPVGTKLPPVRELAAGLGLAVNTVARAYKELEQAGIVQTRSRAGTVITAAGDAGRRRTAEAAAELAAAARAHGISDAETVRILKAALQSGPS